MEEYVHAGSLKGFGLAVVAILLGIWLAPKVAAYLPSFSSLTTTKTS